MRDANLGWMCQRVPGREREGHGGCWQHWNGGQGISCRLPGPRHPARALTGAATRPLSPHRHRLTRPRRPARVPADTREDTSAVQLPGGSRQLGVQPGAAAAGRSCAMAPAGPAAFATARLFLVISVFAQSGLLPGAAQQSSSSPLRVPDCVSEYLLKCFPQNREHIWTGWSSGLTSSFSSQASRCFFCFYCCSFR